MVIVPDHPAKDKSSIAYEGMQVKEQASCLPHDKMSDIREV